MTFDILSRGTTHPGTVRSRNEDAFLERPDIGVWAVADGAGGHGAGDVASAAVIESLADLPGGLSAAELLSQVRLRLAGVHQRLQALAAPDGRPVTAASTIVVALVRGHFFACLWAGDSRAYMLRDGKLVRLTRDHSLVQDLVDAGVLDAGSARHHPHSNVITRAVGAKGALDLDKVSGVAAPSDRFLLCSDGLSGVLDDDELGRLLVSGSSPEDLVQAALRAGSQDNVTAVTIEIRDDLTRSCAGLSNTAE